MADSMNPPPGPMVGNLTVEQGGKALIVHTLIGDVHINTDTVRSFKKKGWRPLSTFTYPSQRIEQDLVTNYRGQLVLQLHRTFADRGYIEFTGVIDIFPVIHEDQKFFAIRLTTNQPDYVAAIHVSVKQLRTLDADRAAHEERMNTELRSIYADWITDVRIFNKPGPIAYKFVYDSAGRKISIMPHDKITAAPSEYPAKAGTTSELLMLLTTVTRSEIVLAGDIEVILHSYPLSKLFIELMDTKTFDFEKVRINVQDYEEWDYINPAADEEFKKTGVT